MQKSKTFLRAQFGFILAWGMGGFLVCSGSGLEYSLTTQESVFYIFKNNLPTSYYITNHTEPRETNFQNYPPTTKKIMVSNIFKRNVVSNIVYSILRTL